MTDSWVDHRDSLSLPFCLQSFLAALVLTERGGGGVHAWVSRRENWRGGRRV